MTTTTQNRNNITDNIRFLSGAQLKYIAFLSMLIDHTNKALIYPYLNGGILQHISDLFDILGRIAFPLFCFLLVEGFFHTRSRGKYLATLIVFGVISEVPFDMFSTATFFNANWNNVMFTLALVLLTIWIIDELRKKTEKLPQLLRIAAVLLVVGVMCLVSMYLGLDYEHHAILIGFWMYIFRDKRILSIPFCFLSMYKSPWALLGFGLSLTYNGERGKQYKLLNYLFYPVHLLVLGILRMYLGI